MFGTALEIFTIACTWVFGVVGLMAAAVTVQGLWNRPRVDARWVNVDVGEGHAPWEGLVVEVRPRQRPVRIERLEIELQYGERQGWRRQRPVHFFEIPSDPPWPHVLQDGEVMEAHRDLDWAIDEARDAIGDARLDSSSRVVVRWGRNHRRRVRC
jgi:hypothetical protein